VGRFYGKRKEVDYITCSTIHSLHHIVSILPKIKAVFVDEIHEMMSKKPKAAYRRLINASIRVAMSATAFKFGGSDKVQKYEVKGWFGPPLVSHHAEDGKLTTKELQKRKILSGATCSFFKVNKPQLPYDVYMDAVTHGIAENNYFHGLVVGLVSKLEGRTLIIVERIEHGDRLKDRMPDALWVQGKDTIETRKEIIQRLKTEQGNVVAIATAGIFGVGIDTWIHNLVNAAGGQAEHVVIQRMGRGLRVASDKQHLNYYDFIFDINDYLKKHSMKRIKILKKEGHNVQIKEEIDF
jgi:superfamily II DNA or RNA helicase